MNWPTKETLYKIENFYGHLDIVGTQAAVQHGMSLLNVTGVIEALIDSLSDDDLREIADHINALDLECDEPEGGSA